MKRRIIALLIAVVFVCLVGCGNTSRNKSRQVPESEITDYVDDYFANNSLEGCVGQDYTATHEWDSETNTDVVQVTAIAEYELGYIIAKSECKYQYDKSSDLWNMIRCSKWIEHIELDENKWASKSVKIPMQPDGYPSELELRFTFVDFENGLFEFNYFADGYVHQDGKLVGVSMEGMAEVSVNNTQVQKVKTQNGNEKEIPLYMLMVDGDMYNINIFYSVRGLETAYIW